MGLSRPCTRVWDQLASPVLGALLKTCFPDLPPQVDLLNNNITPIVPRFGSVGGSGDLIPSCYIARCLTGRGSVRYRGTHMPAGEALAAAGVPPLTLQAKEGLGER